MESLIVFENKDFGKVRTVTVKDQPHFVASDIAKMLGYKKPNNAINTHCRSTLKWGIPHPQSKTKTVEANVIPEGDVYRLIISSELPEAEEFEDWVMDEVLPQIRQTGGYIPIEEEDTELEIMSKAFLIAQSTLEKKDELIKSIQPKADSYDKLLNSDGLMTWNQFVKSANLKVGRSKFMDVLRFKKVLLQDGRIPFQVYVDRDYFEVKQTKVPTGKYVDQTYVTRKGLDWLMKKCGEWDLFKEAS